MDLFFGFGLKFGAGAAPSVAMNGNLEMVMAHIPSGHKLAYRQGTRQHATVAWTPDESYGDGREPSIAISRTHAVEVHRAVDDDRTFYGVGTLNDGRILWLGSGKYDDGITPVVAINDSGLVFEVHQSQNTGRLWYNVGRIDGSKISWTRKDDFADGSDPSISMANNGQAIIAYARDGAVYYRLATTDGEAVEFQAEHKVADGASQPSVAVTDWGWFIICFNQSTALMQRSGMIDGTTVSWGGAVKFDDGVLPTIAAQNGFAVQVHLSQNSSDEFFSTSIITDRSRWMSDRTELYTVPLRQQVLPGSHDAGMYTIYDPVSWYYAQTQDKSIYQQLTYGIRWFDLRVTYVPTLFDFFLHHSDSLGATLTDVLNDIRDFKEKGGQELVVLKLSHFTDCTIGTFGTSEWNSMVQKFEDKLGPYLYRGPLPTDKRLADLTLNDYRNSVLVVVDKDYARDHPHSGFWIYRNATASNAAEGDLRVYDQYSKTDDYDSMKKDQLGKFSGYTGLCEGDGQSLCDLYVLSWTLTPPGAISESVESLAHTPNQHLGDEVGKMPPTNSYGQIINVLYADYTQYARTSDVAIAQRDVGGAQG